MERGKNTPKRLRSASSWRVLKQEYGGCTLMLESMNNSTNLSRMRCSFLIDTSNSLDSEMNSLHDKHIAVQVWHSHGTHIHLDLLTTRHPILVSEFLH
jgi:hypothetical protein